MKDGLGFVAAVNLVIWAGITLYLFVLDRRLKKLEQMCEEQRSEGQKIRRLED